MARVAALLAGLTLSPTGAHADSAGVGDAPSWWGYTAVEWNWVGEYDRCYYCGQYYSGPQSLSAPASNADTGGVGSGGAGFAVGMLPEPTLSSTVSTTSFGNRVHSTSQGGLYYWLMVAGPAGTVPVEMTAVLTTSMTSATVRDFGRRSDAHAHPGPLGLFHRRLRESGRLAPWNLELDARRRRNGPGDGRRPVRGDHVDICLGCAVRVLVHRLGFRLDRSQLRHTGERPELSGLQDRDADRSDRVELRSHRPGSCSRPGSRGWASLAGGRAGARVYLPECGAGSADRWRGGDRCSRRSQRLRALAVGAPPPRSSDALSPSGRGRKRRRLTSGPISRSALPFRRACRSFKLTRVNSMRLTMSYRSKSVA